MLANPRLQTQKHQPELRMLANPRLQTQLPRKLATHRFDVVSIRLVTQQHSIPKILFRFLLQVASPLQTAPEGRSFRCLMLNCTTPVVSVLPMHPREEENAKCIRNVRVGHANG